MRIPIAVQPMFWLFAGLIGWMNSGTLFGTLAWVGIIFVSVLFHELGHALMAIWFGQKADIQLIAFGGVTSFDGPKLNAWQRFLVVLNGPFFGFVLFLLATALLRLDLSHHPLFIGVLRAAQIANLFWTVVNLFPVFPLDGGQLLRIVLEARFGVKGVKASLFVGAILSTLFALWFILIGQYLASAFFFLFAFQNFSEWQKNRLLTTSDQDETVKEQFLHAEEALAAGKVGEAESLLRIVREKTRKGVLYLASTQLLALIQVRANAFEDAYALLIGEEKKLGSDGLALLHHVSALLQHWDIVARLSQEVYQSNPTQEVALANARAFAFLRQPKAAGGWLQTTLQFGGIELTQILEETDFKAISSHPEFRQFIDE